MKERMKTELNVEMKDLKLVNVKFDDSDKEYTFLYPFKKLENGMYVIVQNMLDENEMYSPAQIISILDKEVSISDVQERAFVQGFFTERDSDYNCKTKIENYLFEMRVQNKIFETNLINYATQILNNVIKNNIEDFTTNNLDYKYETQPTFNYKLKSDSYFKKTILQHGRSKSDLNVVLILNKSIEKFYFQNDFLDLFDFKNNKSSIFYSIDCSTISKTDENAPGYVVSEHPLRRQDLALTQDDYFVIIEDLKKNKKIEILDNIFKTKTQNLLKKFNVLNEELFIILHDYGYRWFSNGHETIASILNYLLKKQEDVTTNYSNYKNTYFKFSTEKSENNVALLSFVNKDNKEVTIYVERI